MITAIVQNLRQVIEYVEKAKQEEIKSLRTAIKVEGYRLMKLMQSEIRKSAPGGETFNPLTEIAKRTSAYKHKKYPLKPLAVAVGYNVKSIEPYTVEIGFVDIRTRRLSESWKRIAQAQQTGKTFPVTDKLREKFKLFGYPKKKGQQPYVLKKETIELEILPRPITVPFWRAHNREAMRRIRENYEKKIRGERI